MAKQKAIVFGIVCITVLVVASTVIYLQLFNQTKTSWLAVNDFVVYQQNYSWAGGNATEYMYWNITGINGEIAEIQLVSHGIQISNGVVSTPRGEVNLEVNVTTREIINTTSQTAGMPVGSEFPFWIPESVKTGDPIQTCYGDSFIGPSQNVQIMGQSRACCVVAYDFGSGNSMKRYYEATTGICLLIQVQLLTNGMSVSVNETAVQTNIKAI
jgi:hypothetical protein